MTTEPWFYALRHRARVRVQFEPRDLWIGVYWDKRVLLLNVYVCLLPMLPIRVQVWLGRPLPRRIPLEVKA